MIPGLKGLVGLGAGTSGVSYVDEGAQSSTLAAPSVATVTSTGEKTIVFFGCNWTSAATQTIDSATLDGNAMTALANVVGGVAFSFFGAAVFIVDGAFTAKTLSVGLSFTPADAHVGIISLTNLDSETAVDSDTESGTGAAAALTALTLYTANGITLALGVNDGAGTGFTWTNATELVDTNAGAFRFSYTANLNHDPAGTVKGAGASDNHASAGVTLR